MALERACNRREVLFAGAAMGVAWVCGGCSDDDEDGLIWHSIRYADALLEKGFQHMYEHLSPEDRAVVDNEILKRTDVLIHMIRGKLFNWESRGGASTLAPTPEKKKNKNNRWCSLSLHPDVKEIPVRRNWDLVYDEQRAEEWEQETGIYNRIDTTLYHEIFGHILRVLRNPTLYDDVADSKQRYNEFEDEARVIENRYRNYCGLPLFSAVRPRRVKP